MSKIIITTLLALIVAPTAIAEDTVTYKFPIVQQQFPDLQKTVKAPTIVWQTKKNEDSVDDGRNQNHIISPLFYYQEVQKKEK